MHLEFRTARENDIDFLLELRLQTMDEHLRAMGIRFSRAEHRERVLFEFEHARVVMVDRIDVGMVKYLARDGALYLQQLQVLPAFQGKGVGAAVLERLLREADERAMPMALSVLKKNPALKLYERFGFEVVSEDDFEFHLRRECGKGDTIS